MHDFIFQIVQGMKKLGILKSSFGGFANFSDDPISGKRDRAQECEKENQKQKNGANFLGLYFCDQVYLRLKCIPKNNGENNGCDERSKLVEECHSQQECEHYTDETLSC